MKHSELVNLALHWLCNRCTIAFSEFATGAYENPDAIGWKDGFSILIECKTSRTDFLADRKKLVRRYPFVAMGHKRYFLCEQGVINLADLPEYWGLLWVKGRRISVIKEAEHIEAVHDLSEIRFLVSMLRRVQLRLGKTKLSEWLRIENMPGISLE